MPPSFPPVKLDGGRLPILDAGQVRNDPIFAGVDGQLGGSRLSDRICTIDYVAHRLWLDSTAPAAAPADIVPLAFDREHRYPSLEIQIDGQQLHASLDTAATVALSETAMRTLADELPNVRATSFVPRPTLSLWHNKHPDWPYIADGGATPGIAPIRVPEVRASRVVFNNVWLSTRPGDDVFAGETIDAKLGPTAFGDRVVTIDYVRDDAVFAS
ncbi:MAG: hypothetical protein ACXVAM_16520 [Vulcanimicrobiaceae bacterium]